MTELKKGVWVIPTEGAEERKFYPCDRYLCVSDPYSNEAELQKQKKYWLDKYGITVTKNEFIEVLIFRLKGHWGYESRKQSPRLKTRTERKYVFPTEVLKLDEKQSYRIVE